MAGKTHIERSIRFKFDDITPTLTDITQDLLPGTLAGAGKVMEEIEMTGVSDALRKYLTGHATAQITARFFMNDASGGAYYVLVPKFSLSGTLQVEFGQNGAAPTTNDPRWYGEYYLTGISIIPDGGRILLETVFDPADATGGQWGLV